MKSTIYISFITCSLFSLWQCTPVQEQKPVSTNPLVELNQLSGNTSRIWKISSVSINGVSQALDDCQKFTEITFSKEKSGTLDFYDTSCGKQAQAFSWETTPDTLTILLANQERQKLVIQELNQSTFKYTTVAAEGLSYAFTLTTK
ncbi:lipocalin family protein [Rhodocytophaga rosea]|uniref:Lipocalin family protein n=1 Tax=Rhodocytophaga rosea TaxID=2704465 RepID=A0A6C0GKE6_9BACT|nr:lipocalin family protein [Rhodocytophaga rosea]QHT68506.1 lipocalin family protein [Rhodocytophaga rosea]